jgi:hypothetical protein
MSAEAAESAACATLHPRLAPAVGAFFGALVFTFFGERILRLFGLRDGWWMALPFAAFAVLWVRAAALYLKQRAKMRLYVTPEQFRIGELAVRHFQVTGVRRYKDLRFKGVRVDRGDDLWTGIPASFHEPGQVLEAFRQCGYPVVGK